MDSDNQLSEDEEARIYSMLYYVDSASVDVSKENCVSNVILDTSEKDCDVAVVDKSTDNQISSNNNNTTKNSDNSQIVHDVNESSTAEIEITTSEYAKQNESNTSIKSKRKIRRYWNDEDEDVSTMYFRVHKKKNAKKPDKFANAIITLLNTRPTGKRRTSEGTSCNSEDMATPTSNTKSPSVAKPTVFITPVNTSTPASNKKNKSKSLKKRKPDLSTVKSIVQVNKSSSLTQKLMDKLNQSKNANSESITIESSDDDSVVEVELPQVKHTTIDLDSSEESQAENDSQDTREESAQHTKAKEPTENRKTATSPVPSIVSSTSDDFIQADCTNLNITSETNYQPVFNFRLHGSEFCSEQLDISNQSVHLSTPSKLVDNFDFSEKQNSIVSSTTKSSGDDLIANNMNERFATPANQSMKKSVTPKLKNYLVSEEAYPIPSADVFESESSDFPESVSDLPIAPTPKKKRRKSVNKESFVTSSMKAATNSINVDEDDDLVMANVVGIDESKEADSIIVIDECDNLDDSKSSSKHKKKKSKSKLDGQSEMEKYYNTIYNKDFDHNILRSQMPKDKDLWSIHPSDRGRTRKSHVECGYCNRVGHRSETCYKKPQVCSMCGATGHRDTRCPNKICLNCGSPNNSFSVDCNNCRGWRNKHCGVCKEDGHPFYRCPDIWRRYHLTVKNEVPLVENKKRKPKNLLYCSGCARKGHIINDCNNYIKFSNFKPFSPYVYSYKPMYKPDAVRNPFSNDAITDVNEKKSKLSQNKNNDTLKDTDSGKKKLQSNEADVKSKNMSKEWGYNKTKGSGELVNVTKKSSDESGNVSNALVSNDYNKTPAKETERPKHQNNTPKSAKPNFEDKNKTPTNVSTKAAGSRRFSADDTPKNIAITVSSKKTSDSTDSVVRNVNIIQGESKLEPISAEGNGEFIVLDEISEHDKSFENYVSNDDMSGFVVIDEVSEHDKPIENKISETVVSRLRQLENTDNSLIFLSSYYGQIFQSQTGCEYLNKLVKEYNIKMNLQVDNKGATLKLIGNSDKHADIEKQLQTYIKSLQESPQTPKNLIPRERSKIIHKLKLEMDMLAKNLGEPDEILANIETIKNRMIQLKGKRKIKKSNDLRREMNRGYRLLNMILIGQARLDNGENICKKIDDMINFLKNKNFSIVNEKLRDEIGEIYGVIFSSVPRLDYPQLIQMYYKNNKKSDTLPHHSQKRGKAQVKLLTRICRTRNEFCKLVDNHTVNEERRFVITLKRILDMEHHFKRKNLSHVDILNAKSTLLQFEGYLKVCKNKIKQCRHK